MSAGDVLAISLLVILVLAGVALFAILNSMMRNAGRRDEIAELMDEGRDGSQNKAEKCRGEDLKGKAWERDGDWWRES